MAREGQEHTPAPRPLYRSRLYRSRRKIVSYFRSERQRRSSFLANQLKSVTAPMLLLETSRRYLANTPDL